MDEVNAFFDFSKPFTRVVVSTGNVAGKIETIKDDKIRVVKKPHRENIGKEYAKELVDTEKVNMHLNEMAVGSSNLSSMDNLFDSDVGCSPIKNQKIDSDLYSKYNFFNRHEDIDLPINDTKDEIISTIRDNRVTILQGDTGCGKTTQVPQYILDDACKRNEYCNIICTQPRRIAAMSISQRVCAERQWDIGSLVGYQVGLHARSSEDTRLLYCTTGVLLQKLIQSKNMQKFTHVILDEVHERDQDMDFLLIIVRRLLTTNSKNTKVILMSATIDGKEFATYFQIGNYIPPVLKVDQRRVFSVKETYLCELNRLNYSNDIINYAEPGISNELNRLVTKLIIICIKIDKREAELSSDENVGSILVFLPGVNEIENIEKTISNINEIPDVILKPIKLHSLISPDEQQKVFLKSPPGYRKVILATNIAESSITVPDVKYVIDFCLTKSIRTDTATNFSSLQLHWASRSSCKQRAGRAGRLSNGRVFRLVTKHFYENNLDEYSDPEMLRCPLETVVLKAKVLDMGAPHSILGLALSPPNLSDIRNTIFILKEAGALYKTSNGFYNELDGDLTWIGKIMSVLPLNIHVSRLIIFGYAFSVMEEAVIIAAGLSVKSIFAHPPNRLLAAYNQKLSWADASGSDLFAILRAYKVWCNMHEQGYSDEETEKEWAERYMINTRSMREMHLLIRELKDRLATINIRTASGQASVNWLEREKSIILKIVIAGAFYPNYYIRSSGNNVCNDRSTYHILFGHDPCKTVYFNNFQSKYIGELYTKAFKNLFKSADIRPNCIQVCFEPTSEKVFIIFNDDPEEDPEIKGRVPISGRIRPEVYKALKLRALRVSTKINVMDPIAATSYAESKRFGKMVNGSWIHKKQTVASSELLVYPSLHTRYIVGNVTHIENTGLFWFQPSSESGRLKEIYNVLNGDTIYLQPFRTISEISPGMLVAAPLENKYERGKVLFFRREKNRHMTMNAMINFIDFGKSNLIKFKDIREIVGSAKELLNVPPRVIKCTLANVQPSSIYCPQGLWPDEAILFMNEIFKNDIVELEIYSVIDLVSSVFIKVGNGTINETLIRKGWGQRTEENYMSKVNHEARMRKQITSRLGNRSDMCEHYLTISEPENYYENVLPPMKDCNNVVYLHGPFNPLESKVYSTTKIGSWKSVVIEKDSVNSVMLDTDPQDNHDRLIVAMTATSSSGNNTLTVRQSTLMPNIHGFGPLMALIFCPTMQLKRNLNKSKYVSVLTGLGHNSDYQPLYEEHDMVFDLDVNIDPTDIAMINQIRYSMDTLFYKKSVDNEPPILTDLRFDVTTKIKNLIIRLLEKPRSYIERHQNCHNIKWEPNDDCEVLESMEMYGERSIFPLHIGLTLYEEDFSHVQELKEHAKDLQKMGQFEATIRPTICKLCDEPLENVSELRIHLLSKLHRDRESQIGYQPIE